MNSYAYAVDPQYDDRPAALLAQQDKERMEWLNRACARWAQRGGRKTSKRVPGAPL